MSDELVAGWLQGADGRWHYTLAIESGRILDSPGRELMSGLRSIATSHAGLFALTTNQSMTIAGIAEEDRAGVECLLRDYGMDVTERASPVRQRALACVALARKSNCPRRRGLLRPLRRVADGGPPHTSCSHSISPAQSRDYPR